MAFRITTAPRDGAMVRLSGGRVRMMPAILSLVVPDSYMPAPSSSIEKLMPALQESNAGGSGLIKDETLQTYMRLVWEQGWREQLDEIEELSRDLDSLDASLLWIWKVLCSKVLHLVNLFHLLQLSILY